MTMRRVAPIGTCALVLAFVVVDMTGLAGQQYEAPKTAWGDRTSRASGTTAP